jgi:hypothetical protein
MRDFFGLPGRETPEWLLKLTPLRVLVSFVLFICLATWALDEILVRRVEWAPVGSLVIGLVITANFAWDMPRLFVDGRAALRARLPILRIPIATLGALPSSGRVRVRGRITGALADRAQPIEEGERGIVYQRRLGSVGDPIEKIVVPFLVEADGAQAIVDLRAGAPIVEAVEVSAPPLFYTRLRVGDRIEVIGNVQGGGDGDAYRSGMPRISAGPDDEPLLVFANADSMHRRLVIAAVVELVCAALLCACVVGLVVAWVGLRMIAHPELHKLASLGA